MGQEPHATSHRPPANSQQPYAIRPVVEADRPWLREWVRERWGAETMVVRETVYYPAELPGFVAERGGAPVGVITYRVDGAEAEVMSLDSLLPNQGIGAALLGRVVAAARAAGCRRLSLVTTNDKLTALRFYQKRGFTLATLRPGAIDRDRRLKPEIPLFGEDGIPLRDEIELEMVLE
jgi:GNAT superfamily N-acetyltransferase